MKIEIAPTAAICVDKLKLCDNFCRGSGWKIRGGVEVIDCESSFDVHGCRDEKEGGEEGKEVERISTPEAASPRGLNGRRAMIAMQLHLPKKAKERSTCSRRTNGQAEEEVECHNNHVSSSDE